MRYLLKHILNNKKQSFAILFKEISVPEAIKTSLNFKMTKKFYSYFCTRSICRAPVKNYFLAKELFCLLGCIRKYKEMLKDRLIEFARSKHLQYFTPRFTHNL